MNIPFSAAVRKLEFGPGLEAWLRPVANADGQVSGVDIRLHREVRGSQEFALTQAGFRVPIATLREAAIAFAVVADAPWVRRQIPFVRGLEAQLNPVVNTASGEIYAADFRLFRAERTTGEPFATAAGFRVPVECLEPLSRHFAELAQELAA